MAFKTESDLYNVAIKSDYIHKMRDDNTIIEREVKGLFGIPDLLISKTDTLQKNVKHVFACEMKLSNWKRALSQAYRYKSFAHVSCVLMDESKVSSAISNIEKFKISKVGLLSINEKGIVNIYYMPHKSKPLSKRLSKKNEKRLISRY